MLTNRLDYFNLGNEDNPALGYQGYKYLPDAERKYFQDTASRTSTVRAVYGNLCHHVSDDHLYRGS